MKKLIGFLLLISLSGFADTPPPGTVKVKGGTDGTTIGNVGDALKTTATLSGSVSVSNFPVTQAVSGTFWQATQPVSGILGRSWSLLNSTDSVTSYQGGSWSVGVNNFPSSFDVNVTNLSLPVTGTFWQATQPVSISGSVPVTGTFFQATQPVSAIALPLPSGAASATNQSTEITALGLINTTLGTPMQTSGGSVTSIQGTANSVGNAWPIKISDGSVTNTIKTLGTQVTGTDNGIVTNSVIHGLSTAGGGVYVDVKVNPSGTLTVDASGSTVSVTSSALPTNAAQETGGNLATIATNTAGLATSANQTNGTQKNQQVDGSGNVMPSGDVASRAIFTQTAYATGTVVNNTAITTTPTTFTAPSNAIGFILEAESTNTANIRWAVGSAASTTVGSLAEPGRDTGFLPIGANISVASVSGTQTISIQWVSR